MRVDADGSGGWRIEYFVDIEYRTADGQVINAQHADPAVHALGSSGRRDTLMLWIAGLWLALAGVYLVFCT